MLSIELSKERITPLFLGRRWIFLTMEEWGEIDSPEVEFIPPIKRYKHLNAKVQEIICYESKTRFLEYIREAYPEFEIYKVPDTRPIVLLVFEPDPIETAAYRFIMKTSTKPFLTSIKSQFEVKGCLSIPQYDTIVKYHSKNFEVYTNPLERYVISLFGNFERTNHSLIYHIMMKGHDSRGRTVKFDILYGDHNYILYPMRVTDVLGIMVLQDRSYSAFIPEGKSFIKINDIDLLTFLDDFVRDPSHVLRMSGRATHKCSVCRRPLSDEKSLHNGYGKTCAQKYDLNWEKFY